MRKDFKIVLFAVGLVFAYKLADQFNLLDNPLRFYEQFSTGFKLVHDAQDFNIDVAVSSVDYNANGIDDYADILLGAQIDAQNLPRYVDQYIAGGYPDDNEGVCTDVIWRAFKQAGYNLKAMVDLDIANHPHDYPHIEIADPNIDFRRVPNLHIFFSKYAQTLTLDKDEIDQWQPGDIVVFNNDDHIGIVSDKRTPNGITYILHHGGQPRREENYLEMGTIIGHFRFDASKIDENLLISW